MSGNADTLKLLLPVSLGGNLDAVLTADAQSLDRTQLAADQLLLELFPDGAHDLLLDWERVCGLVPVSGEPLQSRIEKVIAKLRELGDIKAPFFVALAASMGYQISIEHLTPFMAGWSCAGDRLGTDDIWWVWQITILDKPAYAFRAGQSAAGETLGWSPAGAALESLFNDLKPADVLLYFIYP